MKKLISILTLIIVLFSGVLLLTGCENGNNGDNAKKEEKAKVELETAEATYKSSITSAVWKSYKLKVGYPKNDNWFVEDNSSNPEKLVLKDESRKITVELSIKQESNTTWEQNSKLRKESMHGIDKKWGEYEGFYYTLGNSYSGWIFLGNASKVSDGTKSDKVNKLEFSVKAAGWANSSEGVSLEEAQKIMDEDIIANISWEEIDE